MWISNGTFFSEHTKRPVRVLGPVIHRGQPIVDLRATMFKDKKKGNDVFHRLYSNQVKRRPCDSVEINNRTNANTIENLRISNQELLGGAGSLISDGKVQTSGGGFNDDAKFSSGPIVAHTVGLVPVYYLIYVNNPSYGLHWDDVAFYLTSEFRDDFRKSRKVSYYDPPIYEACVYDGGQSRQLWIRNQKRQMRFSGAIVPNYLCLWGVP